MHRSAEKHKDFLIFPLYASFILEKRISSEAVKPQINKVMWQIGCVAPKHHRACRGLL